MTKICYLVTTYQRALDLNGKNVIHDFTPFSRRADAIEGVGRLDCTKADDFPMVGKLELPDESVSMPTQTDPAFLTQLGYGPSASDDLARQYRLAFRRHHLARLSIVPWNEMQDDISEKQDLQKRIQRVIEEVELYDKDHGPDYRQLVEDDAERKEADRLGMKFANILRDYDNTRKSYGMTKDGYQLNFDARTACLRFVVGLRTAELEMYTTKANEAALPEAKQVYMTKALTLFQVVGLLENQQKAGLLIQMQELGIGQDVSVMNLGHDEMDEIQGGRATLQQIADQQMKIDGITLPKPKPRIILPGEDALLDMFGGDLLLP